MVVRALATGWFGAGQQSVGWDGRDESGQSLVEYSLILLFIPLVVVVVLPSVGVDVIAAFQDVADALV